MLRAVIFDFDGIIVDSEPLIFQLTQEMAALEGWSVSEEEYYRDYLALDDRGVVERLYATHGRTIDVRRRDELVRWKGERYEAIIHHGLPAIDGAEKFITELSRHYPLAIASGSLYAEIDHLLTHLGLREHFSVIATADDVERSKPDPAVYLTALARLQALPVFRDQPLQAKECIAFEDAPLGVVAAHAAGLKCIAIPNSRPAEEFKHADLVAADYAGISIKALDDLIRR